MNYNIKNNNKNNSCCSQNSKNNFCFSHIFEVEAFLSSFKKTCQAIDIYKFIQNK